MSLDKNIDTFKWARRMSSIPAIATLFCSTHALAAAPAIVVDAQQTIGSGYWNPQGVAVAPNGTVYVADTTNNQVVQLITNLPGSSNQSQVKTPGFGLSSPRGLAVDAAGDLFIADTPFFGLTSRIIEVVASNGVLTNTVKQIYMGGLLVQPVSLTIDSANTLFVGDAGLFGGAIYSIASGSSTASKVNITGLSGTFTPSAMARDSSGNLYFVNGSSVNGGVYKAPATGGAAQPIATGSFVINQPTGLVLDPSGDLFILSLLGNGSSGEQVVEIPGASPSTPYIIPTSNLQNSSSMALDPSGNLDVVEVANGRSGNGLVTQLDFLNPVDLGNVGVFQTGTAVVFNFEFNAPATLSGFRAVTVGDLGSISDVIPGSISNCKNQTLSGGTNAYQPYTCYQTFEATPQYTGSRVSAIQIEGAKSAILNSTPVYETGLSGAQITYPLDATTTTLGLIQPQGITASGFDQTIYVADLANGSVYSVSGLNGSSTHAVSTGSVALQAPSAVAMNGEGDLFITDFNLGEVVVVPTTTGKTPFVLNTGNLLQHPISLTLDFLGDLYVGDAGPDGDSATSSAPGYVVEVPYKGSAFTLPTPGVTVIFPQALAADSISGNLWIGDGGDASSSAGKVVQVPADGSSASVVSVTGVSDPSGLTFDAAENLYVLDGVANTITVMPHSGASHLLSFDGSSLAAPSALVSSAGSQSFVVANIGNGSSNSLVYLNGNSSTLAFGNRAIHTNSQSQTATVANIGNKSLTLSNPYYSIAKSNPAFNILGSSTCTKGDILSSSTTCSINVQFAPTKTGAQSEQLTINSNAYNSSTPQLNLTGTGTGAQAQIALALTNGVPQAHISQTARKSFKLAKGKANLK